MNIPFETYGDHNLYFTASESMVYRKTGEQWKYLTKSEMISLLKNNLFTEEIYFEAECSLNVLIILKVGL